ncbi:Uncharacterised protein [Mycobacteroides abscessus subsp. massiliense]|nr:hypothetical protein E3G57_000845 [Mycobacteroides abscessus]SIM80837.1 Uncharacterised protein [Mycobacteroides abscessus subsp. abscessus]SKS66490.1 Uncharacterised protein [Mycobacteroides abscessus subsp. massiliense]SLF40988.1 Uncharacterised protein [Mycobacteroides abscessus subsp. bolletii]SKS75617.1 Uncharacterised protein [Mycobacteroides abscessus subsp. massiliense]
MHEDSQFQDLPVYWQRQISKARREAAKYRHERDEARRQLSELTDRLLAGE